LNVHGLSGIKQTKLYAPEPSVPKSKTSEVEIATAKLKKYKSPGSDAIPAEVIQAAGKTLISEIHKFVNSIWNKEELSQKWKSLLLYQFTKKMTKLTAVFIEAYDFYELRTNIVEYSSLTLKSVRRRNYWASSMWVPKQLISTGEIFCIR
jgi:hypothetical protein